MWDLAKETLGVASWMEPRFTCHLPLYSCFLPPPSCLLPSASCLQVVGITNWEARGCGHASHPAVFTQVILDNSFSTTY